MVSVLILGFATVLVGCGGSPKQVPYTPSTMYDPAPGPSTSGNPGPPSGSGSGSASPTGATGVPSDVPTVATNPTVAGEQPPVPPPMVHTQTGAIAFGRFFVETIDWKVATGDNHYMKHYYADTCTQCRLLAAQADSLKSADDRWEGGRLVISRAAIGAPKSLYGAEQTVDVYMSITALAGIDATGKIVSGEPAYSNFHEQLLLKWGDSGWIVVASEGS